MEHARVKGGGALPRLLSVRMASLFVVLAMILSFVPSVAYATEGEAPVAVTVGDTSYELEKLSETINDANSVSSELGAYLVKVPAGTTEVAVKYLSSNLSTANDAFLKRGAIVNGAAGYFTGSGRSGKSVLGAPGVNNFTSTRLISDKYDPDTQKYTISLEYDPGFVKPASELAKYLSAEDFYFDGNLTYQELCIYSCEEVNAVYTLKCTIIVQVGESESPPLDTSGLTELIESAPDPENDSSYYHSDDRWNGSDYAGANGSWWSSYLIALEEAKKAAPTTEEELAAAIDTLQSAIDALIPINEVNATALYEVLHTRWAWNYSGTEITTSAGDEAVSAENTTAMTWNAALREEGTALLESFFDEDGNATEANTTAMQDKVDELAAALSPYLLVNKEAYAQRYDYYTQNRDAAFTLLEQYDPASLTASDYTGESWEAYTAAYDALKEAMAYTIVGGTKEDYRVLSRFRGSSYQEDDGTEVDFGGSSLIASLKAARKQLASTVDITVSFTYINNFAAKYPQIRESGTDLYVNETLTLEGGQSTLAAAMEQADLAFDTKDLRGGGFPAEMDNTSDTIPLFAVFVNGEYYGQVNTYVLDNEEYAIQLHDQDEVLVARIAAPVSELEASSGYESTQIIEYVSNLETEYQDSLALIGMTAPSGTVKVGDKAAFSAAVTGAYAGGNLGRELDAEGLTLFISTPSREEALAAPTIQTGYATDAEGALEYVFAEPGWYTVAMFNVNDNVPTFTDVFNAVTPGEYYSLYAGDFALIHVEPADDEAALIAQYREEYRAAAAAYFAPFHDYDFEAGYYEGTFRAQYVRGDLQGTEGDL